MKKGKSDGATTDMSVLTEVQDLEAVINYVQTLPYNKELVLMGCSQGGFVSALVAATHPGLVKRFVLFYPALCIPDDARAGNMMFAKYDPKNIPEQISCGPMKLGRCYAADVIGMDPYEEIKPYRGPVLTVHGTEDSIVRNWTIPDRRSVLTPMPSSTSSRVAHMDLARSTMLSLLPI